MDLSIAAPFHDPYLGFNQRDLKKAAIEAVKGNDIKALSLLIKKIKNINFLSYSGESLLMNAAQRGYIDIANLLIKHGADIKFVDHNYWSLLTYAVSSHNLNMVDLVIQKGVDIYTTDHIDNSILKKWAYSYPSYEKKPICHPQEAYRILWEMPPEKRSYQPYNFSYQFNIELKSNANKLLNIAKFVMIVNLNTLHNSTSNLEISVYNNIINNLISVQNFPDWYKPCINTHFNLALNFVKERYLKNKPTAIEFESNEIDLEVRDSLLLTDDAALFSGITFIYNQANTSEPLVRMDVDDAENPIMETDDIDEPMQEAEQPPSFSQKIYSYASELFCQARSYLPTLGSTNNKREHEDSAHKQGPEKKRKRHF